MTSSTRLKPWSRAFWQSDGLLLTAILVVAVCLTASDLLTGPASFWQSHQVLTGLATELVMAALVVLGVSRVLERREKRRWRGVALGGLHALHMSWDMTEHLGFLIEVRLDERYDDRVPEGRTYYDILIEILGESETWKAIPDEHVPALLDDLEKSHSDLERLFPLWAPVLIHDDELASIASQIPDLIFASRRLIDPLREARASARPEGRSRKDWVYSESYDAAEQLVTHFRHYDRIATELLSSYIAYRDQSPRREGPIWDDGFPPGAKLLSDP